MCGSGKITLANFAHLDKLNHRQICNLYCPLFLLLHFTVKDMFSIFSTSSPRTQKSLPAFIKTNLQLVT